MHNGVGVRTPRGTGTSGHIERNLSAVRKNPSTDGPRSPGSVTRVSKALADFDSRRKVELECYRLRKKLEKLNTPSDEVELSVSRLRDSLAEPEIAEATVQRVDPISTEVNVK
jgi:serine/arginine repetitive matrix protein 2